MLSAECLIAALPKQLLLHNLRDRACSYRVPAFADGEAQPPFHRHRVISSITRLTCLPGITIVRARR